MKLYVDRFGKLWKRISSTHVIRLEDNNIGGWFDGVGLIEEQV